MDVKRQHQRRASSINGWQLRRGIEPGTLWLARSDVDDDDDAIRQCSQLIGKDRRRFQRGPALPSELPLEVLHSYKMMMLMTTTTMMIGNRWKDD